MEFIMIGDERVEIPRAVVSESREAIAEWIAAEVVRRAGHAVPASSPNEEA